jgi:ABC-type uncharacterized transport system permease subunit
MATAAIIWGTRYFLLLERARRLLGKFVTPLLYNIFLAFVLCIVKMDAVGMRVVREIWERLTALLVMCTEADSHPTPILLQGDFV